MREKLTRTCLGRLAVEGSLQVRYNPSFEIRGSKFLCAFSFVTD
jgi:hypothetical protein